MLEGTAHVITRRIDELDEKLTGRLERIESKMLDDHEERIKRIETQLVELAR